MTLKYSGKSKKWHILAAAIALTCSPLLAEAQRVALKTYDAGVYNKTQDRLYNFDMNNEDKGDPLAKYITVKSKGTREKGRSNDIIGYSDSIYVEHIKDDFSCDVYMAIENYNRILYRDTTVIARGTVNPLRFLDYSFASKQLSDSAFLPKPEAQLRDSKGEVNLKFPVGKAVFDSSDPQNAEEIEKLSAQIETISQSRGATLNSLELRGQSSPEGKYRQNLTLAKERMDYALGFLKKALPRGMTNGMEFKSHANVAPWKEVADMMRRDSLTDQAASIERIIDRQKNIDMQGQAVRKLPYYKKLIAKNYLPHLRRVEYTLHYNIYRTLTADEINELYQQDYKQLSKFEFFKLYRSETDSLKRQTIMRQALEVYPSFMAAANDLSASLISSRKADPSLLRPFAGEKAPQEVNINQVIALLNEGLFTESDSVARFITDNDATHTMLAVNAVLNGRFDDNYATIAKTSTRNEVVMLLAMKRNDEALKLSKQLPDEDATTHYLRAICLNRTNDPAEAYKELKKSFDMDPSLKETAKVDGDVNDLLSMDK